MGNFTTADLIRDAPKFHEGPGGEPHSHGLAGHVLRFISGYVWQDANTLETGAGISTIVFAIKVCTHTCIVPDETQVDRIRNFCGERGIATDHIQFIIGRSQDILPTLNIRDLDFALVDGSHSFPVAFLDYFYIAERLRTGGVLVIDDTNLWTGNVIKKFLELEPEWKIKEDFPKSVAFEKIGEADLDKDWVDQPFVVRKSRGHQLGGRVRSLSYHVKRRDLLVVLKILRRFIGALDPRGK